MESVRIATACIGAVIAIYELYRIVCLKSMHLQTIQAEERATLRKNHVIFFITSVCVLLFEVLVLFTFVPFRERVIGIVRALLPTALILWSTFSAAKGKKYNKAASELALRKMTTSYIALGILAMMLIVSLF